MRQRFLLPLLIALSINTGNCVVSFADYIDKNAKIQSGSPAGSTGRSVMLPHQKQRMNGYWDKNAKGANGPSVVTGYHQIKGWEQTVQKRDPNLHHWSWFAMQEADKKYMHVAPGADPRQLRPNGVPPKSHYMKPIALAPGSMKREPQAPQVVGYSGSHYVKPIHVPLPEHKLSTNARLSVPSTDARLISTQTHANLASHVPFGTPKSATNLANHVPYGKLHGPASAPSYPNASKNTSIQLASKNTNAQLATEKVNAQMAKAGTRAQADFGSDLNDASANEPDSFQDPNKQNFSPYGASRHPVMTYSRSSTDANVHGKILRKGRGH